MQWKFLKDYGRVYLLVKVHGFKGLGFRVDNL